MVFDRGLDCSEFFLGNFDRFRPGRAEKHNGIFDFLLRKAEAGSVISQSTQMLRARSLFKKLRFL